ncbi:MAG TPA: MlaD family protein, partial [Marmoricola sp.]|nr:MlaD family protein [Marmoricola sp.]
KVGDIVEIAGIRVGRVNNIAVVQDGSNPYVRVDFDVHNATFGSGTTASIEVLNLLGEKYLRLAPQGSDTVADGWTSPLLNPNGTTRNTAAYDIVGTLSNLSTRTDAINLDQLRTALNTLSSTINAAAPDTKATFNGIARISETIASRNDSLKDLFTRAKNVTGLLNARKGDLVALMQSGDKVFQELITRHQAIHDLLVNATALATQLKGVATDNQAQIGPALQQLNAAISFLNQRKDELEQTIHYYGPYASILMNVIGTGPWFDAYVPNLPGLVTGEFVPGKRTYTK